MEVGATSFYVERDRRSVNQVIQDYVRTAYGVSVSKQHIGEVRRMCRRERNGEPQEWPQNPSPKTDFIRAALLHLNLSP